VHFVEVVKAGTVFGLVIFQGFEQPEEGYATFVFYLFAHEISEFFL
jgi:hypothetical protein